jgi:hypothetical protein
MKKILLFSLMVVSMMTAVRAQESAELIYFFNAESSITYDLEMLTDLIYASDTLFEESEIAAEFEQTFPPKRGSHEPAYLILTPVDNYLQAIFIQQNKKGKILSFRILTNDGWFEADEKDLQKLRL